MAKKNGYTEPTDYFPKEIRKKMKIGEFAEKKPAEKSKSTKKSTTKKK